MSTDPTEKKDVTLYVSSKATTKLAIEKKSAAQKQMEEKIKAEEAKLQARRVQQEQTLAARAEKKANYRHAKNAEQILAARCDDLEEALKTRGNAKTQIEKAEAGLKEAQEKSRRAWERSVAAEAKARASDDRCRLAHSRWLEVSKATDASIIELKSQRLREAWTNSEAAWDRLQKAIRKRDKDRALKKRVKELLG